MITPRAIGWIPNPYLEIAISSNSLAETCFHHTMEAAHALASFMLARRDSKTQTTQGSIGASICTSQENKS